jgi:hypothetical protein
MYWQGVLSRLSIPGLCLLALGAALGYGAKWICGKVLKQGGERAVVPVKVAGLLMALVGALILLDIIPI